MEIKKALWRHNKSGREYRVLGTAFHSETMEECVVYQAQYDSDELGPKPLFVRPAEMWSQMVEINGELKPRFQLTAPSQ